MKLTSYLKNLLASAIICGIILFASCEKDKGPVVIRPVLPVDSTVYYISFRGYIQPLFNDYCIGCHHSSHPFLNLQGSASYEELLYTGASAPYVDTVNPDNSLLIQRVMGAEWPIMPPDPPQLLESDIDSIRKWMLQGARDN